MPLDINRLGNAIAAQVGAIALPPLPDGTPQTFSSLQNPYFNAYCKAIATAVVQEIEANAEAEVKMATHTHSGVLTGSGVSGPPIPGTVETGGVQ